jgi:small subunit ribosomal protein S8
MIDPIGDMLTRIRNAAAVKKEDIVMPMSKMKHGIAKILERDGWVGKVEVIKEESKKNGSMSFDKLKIVLKYDDNGRSAITALKRVSKPGCKVYSGKDTLPRVLNNAGIAILSTSSGLMTNKEARKRGVGGEVLCEIY